VTLNFPATRFGEGSVARIVTISTHGENVELQIRSYPDNRTVETIVIDARDAVIAGLVMASLGRAEP
jgi:hypothetical protein